MVSCDAGIQCTKATALLTHQKGEIGKPQVIRNKEKWEFVLRVRRRKYSGKDIQKVFFFVLLAVLSKNVFNEGAAL